MKIKNSLRGRIDLIRDNGELIYRLNGKEQKQISDIFRHNMVRQDVVYFLKGFGYDDEIAHVRIDNILNSEELLRNIVGDVIETQDELLRTDDLYDIIATYVDAYSSEYTDQSIEQNPKEESKMEHISGYNDKTYEISRSYSYSGKFTDDICLIWNDRSTENRQLIGWYYGEYDYKTTEEYIRDYYEKQADNSMSESKSLVAKASELVQSMESVKPEQPNTIDLSLRYVNFIEDCLTMIRDHNLIGLVYDERDDEGATLNDLQTVLDEFCTPITNQNDDVKVIIENE